MNNSLDFVSAKALDDGRWAGARAGDRGFETAEATQTPPAGPALGGEFRIKPSVKVFADFSRSKFLIPCNYLVMITEIMDKTPVYSYVSLDKAAARDFEHLVNIADCADRFHIVPSHELNAADYEPDVNVVISDTSRELHFSRSVQHCLRVSKTYFLYNGVKKDIEYIIPFLKRLFTDIYRD